MYTWRERDITSEYSRFFCGFSSVESLTADVNIKTFLVFMETINEPVGSNVPETELLGWRVYKAKGSQMGE